MYKVCFYLKYLTSVVMDQKPLASEDVHKLALLIFEVLGLTSLQAKKYLLRVSQTHDKVCKGEKLNCENLTKIENLSCFPFNIEKKKTNNATAFRLMQRCLTQNIKFFCLILRGVILTIA